jgi:lauroyl/myristoyl acyltransferase
MNAALERIIRAHPEQYMWATRRFRNSPDLGEKTYE